VIVELAVSNGDTMGHAENGKNVGNIWENDDKP